VTAAAGQEQQDDDACWREAARLRAEHRKWVVIWLASERCYKAYRRMRGARHDTVLAAATASEMAALIVQAEQAVGPPACHTPDTS
jgi:hypothetical protein